MANSECAFKKHHLTESAGGTSLHATAAIRCLICGVGFTAEFQPVDNNPQKTRASLKVFPARGSRTISKDMMAFFLTTWEGTCQEMEQDGLIVVRDGPHILSPESDEHT